MVVDGPSRPRSNDDRRLSFLGDEGRQKLVAGQESISVVDRCVDETRGLGEERCSKALPRGTSISGTIPVSLVE